MMTMTKDDVHRPRHPDLEKIIELAGESSGTKYVRIRIQLESDGHRAALSDLEKQLDDLPEATGGAEHYDAACMYPLVA